MVAFVMSILLSLSLSLLSPSSFVALQEGLSIYLLGHDHYISLPSFPIEVRRETEGKNLRKKRGVLGGERHLRPALLVNVPSIWYTKGWVGIRGF